MDYGSSLGCLGFHLVRYGWAREVSVVEGVEKGEYLGRCKMIRRGLRREFEPIVRAAL